jgi:hypothetical protein
MSIKKQKIKIIKPGTDKEIETILEQITRNSSKSEMCVCVGFY